MILTPTLQNVGLTVQDRPPGTVPPIYNGVNPSYPGLRVLNATPPLFLVDNFLTPHECDFLIHAASDSFLPAPVVGKGSGELSPSRTSSTCYLAREDVPDLLRKVTWLTGKPMEHCELPQVGRYLPSQQYMQHYDAFDLGTEDGQRFASNGGQRVVTVLIYLNDVPRGGATHFPCLNVDVQPRKGTAVVFFPATVDGALDKCALHAALPAVDTKYVSQIWIRQGSYNGMASKRLTNLLGAPLTSEEVEHNRRICSVGTAAAAAALAAAVVAANSAAASTAAATTAAIVTSGGGGASQLLNHHVPLLLAPFPTEPVTSTGGVVLPQVGNVFVAATQLPAHGATTSGPSVVVLPTSMNPSHPSSSSLVLTSGFPNGMTPPSSSFQRF